MYYRTVIDIRVDGEPKGQPRARAFSYKSKATGKPSVRMYDPGTAEGWKSAIAMAAKEAGFEKAEGAVRLRAVMFFKRPKRLMRKIDPEGPIPKTTTPDPDNVLKAIMDALTQVGLWHDDRQCYDPHPTCYYAAKGETPYSLIQVHELVGGN